MKQSYLDRLHDIDAFTEMHEVQDEYAVLDRAGRLQIPRDVLEKLNITGNRIQLEVGSDRIILKRPEQEEKKQS
jgi:bifunctional DNA-binding transcriptional regulator/antitoxin component of YhaV-PrlF toxin-antitoxin module